MTIKSLFLTGALLLTGTFETPRAEHSVQADEGAPVAVQKSKKSKAKPKKAEGSSAETRNQTDTPKPVQPPSADRGVKPPTTDDEEPPTTLVTPSQDTSDADEAPKVAVDANRCTQCQIQAEAHRKLKAEEADASANIRRNQELQAKLKPDEDKSSWIKVESNLRMWDIKVQSLRKNITALDTQLKQDCQSCLNPPPTDGKAPK